jgi:NADH:ubiquinone oxidoreductase subunit H
VIALCAGLPLVLAHLFTVVFLGGWWAFVSWLDGLTWLQTILKNLLVVGFMVWLRRRPAWRDSGSVAWRLPAAALIACLGAVAWVVLSGAIL